MTQKRQRSVRMIHSDTVALLNVAVYYGMPKYGHSICYKQAPGTCTEIKSTRGLGHLHCIECGKPLFIEAPAIKNTILTMEVEHQSPHCKLLAAALRTRWVEIKEEERKQGKNVPESDTDPWDKLDPRNQWIDIALVKATLQEAVNLGIIPEELIKNL